MLSGFASVIIHEQSGLWNTRITVRSFGVHGCLNRIRLSQSGGTMQMLLSSRKTLFSRIELVIRTSRFEGEFIFPHRWIAKRAALSENT